MLILSSKLTTIIHRDMFLVNQQSIPKLASAMGLMKPSEKFLDKVN